MTMISGTLVPKTFFLSLEKIAKKLIFIFSFQEKKSDNYNIQQKRNNNYFLFFVKK
jgi:hypothetical protein